MRKSQSLPGQIIVILLLLLTAKPAAAAQTVTIDINKTGPEINPFIYGQFIEHLGRCIYGGIWAEMLEDRKFYFPITAEYDPYVETRNTIKDTQFPIIGRSPWQITGGIDGVSMNKNDSFAGEQTPQIKAGSGIRQHDLAVVNGKRYDGYIWLKPLTRQVKVDVIFHCGPDHVSIHSIQVSGSDYARHNFSFLANTSSSTAHLEIKVTTGQTLIGTLSLMPGDNIKGMRSDTIKLLKELDAPIYRWPGGNFVSGYNWRDGIGDRDRRPPRVNPAWTGVEHNDFGTDEFIAFCREINTEPMIAVNTGFGDAYSAAQWVEYCNASPQTIGGSWRTQNGSPQPFGVKYWCVGNEMFGPWQLGFMQLSHYKLKHNRVAIAMKDADLDVKLVACGAIGRKNTRHDPGAKEGWSEGMLKDCADHMDYISEHFYEGRQAWIPNGKVSQIAYAALLKNSIKRIADQHRRLQPQLANLAGRTVPIAMDEWNYWHRDYVYGELGCIYNLVDGLGVAAGLHEYFRNSDIITMAHYAQTVNVIGCIKTTKTEAGFATTGLALKMYRKHFGRIPLRLDDNFGDLDVTAALSKDGNTLTIGIVNPTSEMTQLSLKILNGRLNGPATRYLLSGPGPAAFNTPGETRQVDIIRTDNIQITDGMTIPACSCAIYLLDIDKM